MGVNKKCPRCGSTKTQLSTERSKHGFLWLLLFGMFFICWWLIKACVALMVLIYWDWWFALIQKSRGKGYVWVSKRIIENRSKVYYCHNCSHNFRA